MNNWQPGDITVDGLRLHYTRTGGDKPAVLLAHGFSDDGLCWTPVAERLAADYDVVMLDARGHGRSDGPERGYGSQEHAADVAGAIKELGLEHPAVLGHSMGAMTALALAGLYPGLPRAILLEDPPPTWMWQPEASPPVRGRMGGWIIDLKRKTREEMIAGQRASSPGWSDAELGPWADSKLRLSFNVLSQEGNTPIDWSAVIRKIACPALLITADTDKGAIVAPDAAGALHALLPQTRVVHIAGAGHSIRREQFEPYMTAVKSYLADIYGA